MSHDYWMEPALANRPFEPRKGDDSYWDRRNALVAAVHAVQATEAYKSWARKEMYVPHSERVLTEADEAAFRAFSTAIKALEAFDASHGGEPIL